MKKEANALKEFQEALLLWNIMGMLRKEKEKRTRAGCKQITKGGQTLTPE